MPNSNINQIFYSSLNSYFNSLSSQGYNLNFYSDDDFNILIKDRNYLIPKFEDKTLLRAGSDIGVFYTQYHNRDQHDDIYQKISEPSEIKRYLFDELEKVRIALIASNKYQGIEYNISYFYKKFSEYHSLNTKDNFYRSKIAQLYFTLLKDQNNIIFNQKKYAEYILKFIESITSEPDGKVMVMQEELDEIDDQYLDQIEQNIHNHDSQYSLYEKEVSDTKDIEYYNDQNINQEKSRAIFQDIDYKIYTTEFDEIIRASKLANFNEIKFFRSELDFKIRSLKIVDKKLLRKFLLKLESYNKKILQDNHEEGVLDNKKLAHILSSSSKTSYFKDYHIIRSNYAAITLLIDNSGSMRGKQIAVAAICADLLASILEKYNIKIEIIGFTTKEWRGGESRKLWAGENSPMNPGRLNDLRHIIYKSFSDPYNKSRLHIPIMLKESILKENIDGEAVMLAYNRIIKRPENKKVILVISDGAPLDEATCNNNPSDFLSNHLADIIKRIELSKKVDLLAIGIEHDVGKFYKNNVKILSPDNLINVVLEKLIEIL